MHLNILFVPTLLGAGLLFLLGFKISPVTRSTPYAIACFISAGILAIPALLFVAYYGHVLDRAVWFYAFRAAPYTELTASGIGVGAGLIVERVKWVDSTTHLARPKLMALGMVLFCCGLLFIPYIKPLAAPLTVPLQDKWSDGVCLQSTPATCGPCSAATLLRQFKIVTSEHELAAECFSYQGGTENWYVVRALRRRGIETQYLVTSPQPATLPVSSIAGVQLGGAGRGGHFITILERSRDRYIIGDPLVGRLILTPKQVYSRYYFTGFFLIARRISNSMVSN